ncbi:hypothetical protein MJ1HA_2016 [Metallosphaera sedula]|nr:hypothetical protein MJ1HA_2016 [Metallosphaera sedula]
MDKTFRKWEFVGFGIAHIKLPWVWLLPEGEQDLWVMQFHLT